MSPNVPKVGHRLYTNGLDGFAKKWKNCSLDGPFLGIFGSNFSDFENFGPKNDQPVFEGKSYLLPG